MLIASALIPKKIDFGVLETSKTNNQLISIQEKPKVGLLGIDLTEDTFINKIIRIAKNPTFVFILVFLISLPQFNRLFFGLFPQFLLENGQIKITGILVKAVLATGLYILFNFLL